MFGMRPIRTNAIFVIGTGEKTGRRCIDINDVIGREQISASFAFYYTAGIAVDGCTTQEKVQFGVKIFIRRISSYTVDIRHM